MKSGFSEIIGLFAMIVGVAIVAVIVSGQANTAGVIGAAGKAFSNALGTAVSPVTGGGSNLRGAGLLNGVN